MKIFAMLLSLMLGASLLAGCEHTAAGFGQDMQSNGKAITNSAHNNSSDVH